jgi:hypothetical protein
MLVFCVASHIYDCRQRCREEAEAGCFANGLSGLQPLDRRADHTSQGAQEHSGDDHH